MKVYRTKCEYQLLPVVALSAFFVLAGAAKTHAQTSNVALAAGTVVEVKLDDTISSKDTQKGERFTATVKNNKALPSGSKVEGVVRGVKAREGKNPGMLDLAFQRVTLPNGRSYSMNGSLISLDEKYVTRDANGRLIAKKGHKTDRLTYVGYGAGAGLIVGLLADKKNTLRNTAIGAGLGYLYGALEKDKSKVSDVTLKEGTTLGVRLDNRLAYAR